MRHSRISFALLLSSILVCPGLSSSEGNPVTTSRVTGETPEEITKTIEDELLASLKASANGDAKMALSMFRLSVPDDAIAVSIKLEPSVDELLAVSGTMKNTSHRFVVFRSVYSITLNDCVGKVCTEVITTALRVDTPLPRGETIPFKGSHDVSRARFKGTPIPEMKVVANWSVLEPKVIEEEEELNEDEES